MNLIAGLLGRNKSCYRAIVRSTLVLALVCLLGAVAGCGGGSSKGTPPTNLAYPQATLTAVVGQAIATDAPTVTGTVTAYVVSPALPAGLSLSASTGAISGTPTAASAPASYTITASNAAGSTAATVQIVVNPASPTALVYPQTTLTGIVGQAIASDTPTVTGTVTSYSVSPALPAGLSLNASTGAISGTPTSVAAQATYTVTAANVSGSTTASVQIVVNPPAPANLVYPQSTITATVGQASATDTPTVIGTVTSYSVKPALPAGLTLNTSTGAISGTPTAVAAQATYTVTATNVTGSTTATVQITVNPAAPTNLVYPQTTITTSVGFAITTDTPTVTGTVSGYSVNPALPAGLSLDPSTGAISGTPTAASAQTSYTVTATNFSGSTTATLQITVNPVAPTNLVYPFLNFTADVGTAISPDTPTVTGTVNSYSVTPALPAGLFLNPSTGEISGIPTTVSPLTRYTVTATNAGGLTSTIVQITVVAVGPQNLVYPQTSISAVVGQPLPTDIPYVFGPVSGYSITPALPAGLSFNTSNGAISGTPTAASAQTTYTIQVNNSAGSTTATVQIAVVSFSGFELFDLGHANSIQVLRLQANRLFSQDYSGHWVLWDYAAATQIASGDPIAWSSSLFSYQTQPFPSDMAGPVLAVGIADAVEIRSSADATLITTISAPSLDPSYEGNAWWKLATDGSYIVSGDSTGLYVWSTTDGHLLFKLNGDYTQASAYAAPAQIQIAKGPAGASVIETDAVSAGTSAVSPAFTGTFNAWFSDGSHFITNSAGTGSPLSYNVYIYSAAGTQQGSLTLGWATGGALGGYGNWFWSNNPTTGGTFGVYAVGSSTPTTTVPGFVTVDATIAPSGSTIGLLPDGTATAYILDLSGPTPNITQSALPVAYDKAFAAISPTQWVVGNSNGVVLDGPSASTTPRFFGYGDVFSMAGAPGSVAIATAIGKILLYAPGSEALINTIPFFSSELQMSSDGTILAAEEGSNSSQFEPSGTLNIYSLPSGTLSYSYPDTDSETPGSTDLLGFTLSSSGNALGRVLGTWTSSSGQLYYTYTREETPLSGSPILWSDTPPLTFVDADSSLYLSPDGTLVATSTAVNGQNYSSSSTTTIYKNGSLVATVGGFVVGWIDNNRLLVDTFSAPQGLYGTTMYLGSVIYDATGAQVAALPHLPELVQYTGSAHGFKTVDSDSIYAPSTHSIYSLTTGDPLWTETFPNAAASALSGSYVVFVSGTRVLVDLH